MLAPSLAALVAESYARSYKHLLTVMSLAELEEVVEYKRCVAGWLCCGRGGTAGGVQWGWYEGLWRWVWLLRYCYTITSRGSNSSSSYCSSSNFCSASSSCSNRRINSTYRGSWAG